jgi:hypothetical protein
MYYDMVRESVSQKTGGWSRSNWKASWRSLPGLLLPCVCRSSWRPQNGWRNSVLLRNNCRNRELVLPSSVRGCMRRLLSVVTADGAQHDVDLCAAEDTPLSEITSHLAEVCGVSHASPLYAGDLVLPGELTLADSPLRDGCRVGLGRPVPGYEPLPGLNAQEVSATPMSVAGVSATPMSAALLTPGAGGALLFHQPPRLHLEPRRGWRPPPARSLVSPTNTSASRRRHWWPSWDIRSHAASRKERSAVVSRLRERLLWAAPDAERLLQAATTPDVRLWERRPTDPDYLSVRCGTGDLLVDEGLLSSFSLEADLLGHRIPDLPVVVRLRQHQVIGIAGQDARYLAMWFAGQIAVLHSPVDVTMWVFTSPEGLRSWSWLRWLPPATAEREDGRDPRISSDDSSHAQQLGTLLSLVDERRRRGYGPVRSSDIVVFLDGIQELASLSGVRYLIGEGPGVGVYVVCLNGHTPRLPEECRQLITQRRDGLLEICEDRTDIEFGVRPDTVSGVRPDTMEPEVINSSRRVSQLVVVVWPLLLPSCGIMSWHRSSSS